MATILVVDDRPLNRSVLTTLLGYRGHRLVEASSGTEAINKVLNENPELVITDILMPNMDGYELVRKLGELDPATRPQVIFYSATYLEAEARALARACGVSRVICKPAEPEHILRIVDEALASHKAPHVAPTDERAQHFEAVRILSNKLYRKVEETEELNAQLERRVAERTAELANANRLLQQQILERQNAEAEAIQSREMQLRMKGELLSHVSHELRSPLAVVHQFVTILLDGLGAPLNSNQREYLEIALRNVIQLKHMIDDLLEASRADTCKLTVKPSSLSLAAVIADSVEVHGAVAAEKGIALKTDVPHDLPFAYADPGRISQVLTNLLDNAFKFSPANTAVTIRARVFEEDPAFVCISVTDCGCGIRPEDADRVFDRLYQVNTSIQANRRGLGLGLFICKELVSLHQGKIWIDAKQESGTRIHFTLPVFTIESIVAPLLRKEVRLAPSVALVKIEVSSGGVWRTERDRERALYRVNRVLERCVLPDFDVLLPPQNGEHLDYFYIVARTDERGAQVLASRIRDQLSRCGEPGKPEVKCLVSCEVMDLKAIAGELPLDECTAHVAAHLQERLKTSFRKGTVHHDRKENTPCGR